METNDDGYPKGRKYKNGEITVYWKPGACVHASYCYRELIEVFDPGRRPWVDMSGSTTARIIDVVNMCPTEALTWKWNDDEKNKDISVDQTNHVIFRRPELLKPEDSQEEIKSVSVKVMPDGPIVLKGDFTFQYNGIKKKVKEGILSICRCGASKQMPFCDGAHRKIGYEDK
jgi:uncharacterized Fe-S cluster protein YjdI